MIGVLSRAFGCAKCALPGDLVTVDNITRVGDSFCRAVVAFVSRKSKKTNIATSGVSGPTERRALFGPPLLLQGEDPAAYDELLARVNAAVLPVNIIEEILINDFVFLEWEVLRWRRLNWSSLQARGLEALKGFLVKQLPNHNDLYSKHFPDYLK